MTGTAAKSEKADKGISLRCFLETVPPGGQDTTITDLGHGTIYESGISVGAQLVQPDILLHCDTHTSCGGLRLFLTKDEIML
jgi:hypothetical protein